MKYLRTMTEKSLMGFGKYKNMHVGEVMKTLTGSSYLRWAYFNCSMISFHEELLIKLGIFQKDRITKPGTDEEKYFEIMHRIQTDDNPKTKLIRKLSNKKRIKTQKQKNRASLMRDRITYSKSSMQARNHGHY